MILILDDNPDIVELLEIIFHKEGFQTIGITNSKNIDEILQKYQISLLIVDRNLPCIEGTKLVQKLRLKGDTTPAIFLTAKDSREEKLEGFKRGGDDYITKPFDNDELVFRVRAILKRTQHINNILSYQDITMNLDSLEVYIDNEEVQLTKIEFKLLQTFLEQPKQVLTRDYLLDVVWNCGIFNDTCNEKSVNVAIKRLKTKIDKNNRKQYIQSVRGVGYKLR